jgi:hypothetical protein
MLHKLSKQGYILNQEGEIETISYREYLGEFGSDETTTPQGIAPRLFVDGKKLMTWGVRGNNLREYHECNNKREAIKLLFEIWENNAYNNCNAPRFHSTKKELFEDFAQSIEKDVEVIKRYYRILYGRKKEKQTTETTVDTRPITTKETILNYLKNNRQVVQASLNQLNLLKTAKNKEEWQVKANSLVQKVSGNDFRQLTWKEIYNLIKENC